MHFSKFIHAVANWKSCLRMSRKLTIYSLHDSEHPKLCSFVETLAQEIPFTLQAWSIVVASRRIDVVSGYFRGGSKTNGRQKRSVLRVFPWDDICIYIYIYIQSWHKSNRLIMDSKHGNILIPQRWLTNENPCAGIHTPPAAFPVFPAHAQPVWRTTKLAAIITSTSISLYVSLFCEAWRTCQKK